MDFYSWNLSSAYEPMANIGVVTADPMRWFEVMNLLMRHNLPFQRVAPGALPLRAPHPFKLLIVLDPPDAARLEGLDEFARQGGTVVLPGPSREGADRTPRSAQRGTAGLPRPSAEREGELKTDERV